MRTRPEALRDAEISNNPDASSSLRSQSQSERAPTRLAYSVAEAAALTSISRSKLYELMKSGVLGSIKISGRRLLTREHLAALLNGEGE
jgi:excisionase family DNA binding protein